VGAVKREETSVQHSQLKVVEKLKAERPMAEELDGMLVQVAFTLFSVATTVADGGR